MVEMISVRLAQGGEMPQDAFKDRKMVIRIIFDGGQDASPDGEGDVQCGNAADEKRNDNGGNGGDLRCGVEPCDAKYVADAHAACVAHEDLGGMPVVVKESYKRAGEDEKNQCIEAASGEPRDERECDRGDAADAAGQPVHTIYHVECVDHGGNPEDGYECIDRCGEMPLSGQVDVNSKIPCEGGRDDLEDEFHLGRQAEFVVDNAQRDENGKRDEKLDWLPTREACSHIAP